MTTLFNRVKFTTATTGTGTLTVGSALAGFRTPAQAGVPDGAIVSYLIEDTGNAWETGYGTYTVSSTSVSRNVRQSSNSDNPINLSGGATVRLTVLAEDLNVPFAIASSNYAETTINAAATQKLTLDTEVVNDDGLISLASNNMTVLEDGWFEVNVIVTVKINGGSPATADGEFRIQVLNSGAFDNTVALFAIEAGESYVYVDFNVNSSVVMASGGGNIIEIGVVNNGADNMTAYVHEARVSPLHGTNVSPTNGGYTKTATMWHDQSAIIAGNSFNSAHDGLQKIVYQDAAANNDEFKNGFSCVSGTYSLNFLGQIGTGNGRLTVYIDGVNVGQADFYNASLVQNTTKTISSLSLSGGYHTLRCVVDKNASSSGYLVALAKIYLKPSSY